MQFVLAFPKPFHCNTQALVSIPDASYEFYKGLAFFFSPLRLDSKQEIETTISFLKLQSHLNAKLWNPFCFLPYNSAAHWCPHSAAFSGNSQPDDKRAHAEAILGSVLGCIEDEGPNDVPYAIPRHAHTPMPPTVLE